MVKKIVKAKKLRSKHAAVVMAIHDLYERIVSEAQSSNQQPQQPAA